MLEKEKLVSTGKIIVITGRTGSGKDFLVDNLGKDELEALGLSRVVTHATRPPREDGSDEGKYHFCSNDELFAMYENGELVEKPVLTGTDHKATSKKELLQVLEGKNKIWRIDLSLAAKIAKNEYYNEQFDSETAQVLAQSTVVIYIDVEQEVLDSRRKSRSNYNPQEYVERDSQELATITADGKHFNVRIKNPDGEVEQTKSNLLTIVTEFVNSK